MRKWISFFITVGLLFLSTIEAQTLKEQAQSKTHALSTLMTQANEAGIDILKEKTTLRTAELFLAWADWDEANQSTNTGYFKLVSAYKDTAEQTAALLPDFERRDVISMLDESIAELSSLISAKTFRKTAPNVDWEQVTLEGDQLTFNGKPVFLTDYTWKEKSPSLMEYHGAQDGFFIMHNYVTNENGTIQSNKLSEIKNKASGRLGFIFLNHKNTPTWANIKYGPDFRMRTDTYTAYDIDNPGARELNKMLLKGFVPHMAGKKYSELGYMLCNEPHFYTTIDGDKELWASGGVSHYTIDKFKIWLAEKHDSIQALNTLWGTSFENFDSVKITVPIDLSLQGTPKWFDWVSFNFDRVTDWYQFLKDEIRTYDPEAKVHLKVMPNLLTENKTDHGIDMEAITEMSEIIGNDASTSYKLMWGSAEWQKHYAWEWRELCMSYDFFKSVSPDKIIYNTENHFLSTGRSRDLYMNPKYVRSVFWLAHTLGLTANQIWYWPRKADGSLSRDPGKGYGGSNNQQPRVTNEVATTMLDLNTYSDEIMAMQRQRKPIRIFYSKTSNINKKTHMDDLFELYEYMNFDGIPLGFASKNIISKQDNSLWDAILIYKTQFVTHAELDTLQSFLNHGGTILLDAVSLKKDEYGKDLPALEQASGTLIHINSIEQAKSKAWEIVDKKGLMPEVSVGETNGMDRKGCTWKCIKTKAGNNVLSIVNLGKTAAKLNINLKNATKGTYCKDIIKGIEVTSTPTLQPYEMYFIEVMDKESGLTDALPKNSFQNEILVYPNPVSECFNVKAPFNLSYQLLNLEGKIIHQSVNEYNDFSIDVNHLDDGLYFLRLNSTTNQCVKKIQVFN